MKRIVTWALALVLVAGTALWAFGNNYDRRGPGMMERDR